MKKDRNCMNASYPVYPNMMGQPMMMNQPMMGQPMMPMTNMNTMNGNYMTNSSNDNYSSLNNQIANLERRVTRLENLLNNNSSTYSESNFYMV